MCGFMCSSEDITQYEGLSTVVRTLLSMQVYLYYSVCRGGVAQEVELSSGSRRVAGSIPPWACRSVLEQDA